MYKILDLFAGIGGLSYGFEIMKPNNETAFDLVCAVEIDKYACDTLKTNLERRNLDPSVVLQADLTDPLTHEHIMKKCRDGVDVIVGGPPCQSFSYIGARSARMSVRKKWADDPRDQLYVEYVSLVRELNPSFLVFENVKGILTKKDPHDERYIDLVVQSIHECGYSTRIKGESRDYLMLNAADFGVPQTRERVFILANNLGLETEAPSMTHSFNGEVPSTQPWVTLWEALGDLPPVQALITPWGISDQQKVELKDWNSRRNRGSEETPYHWDRFNSHRNSLAPERREFLDHIAPSLPSTMLTAHVARGQQLSDIRLFEALPEGITSKAIFRDDSGELCNLKKYIKYNMDSFLDKYRKQSMNAPCTTIFAHMRKDGNRFIHPDSSQARTLTVREAARIQSFPDDFIFTAPGNVRYHAIGNAVPPLMAKAVAKAVHQTLKWGE